MGAIFLLLGGMLLFAIIAAIVVLKQDAKDHKE
jgi:hypothetical protein